MTLVDAATLAGDLLGDAIYANVLLLGAAWQAGLVPLSIEALRKAIELNGAGVDGNLQAFELGRWSVSHPLEARAAVAPEEAVAETLEQKIERRAEHLVGYQGPRLAKRYRKLVDQARAAEATAPGITEAVAEGYFKLLAYKDEYEVARLHTQTLDQALAEAFGTVGRVTYHMAPPILGRKDADGRPKKSEFGPWMGRALRLLARFRFLRGTPFDPFGYSSERRAERRMIRDYRKLVVELLEKVTPANAPIAVELARLPLQVRGFGHVKQAAAERAAEERAVLLERFHSGERAVPQAAE